MNYFQPFWCYVDEQSVEASTQKCKRKYKLFIDRLPFIREVLYFFVSTSKNTTAEHLTFCVEEVEWENLIPPYLKGTSRFDIRRIVQENEDELTQKLVKRQLACVARLPDSKKADIRVCFNALLRHDNLSPYEQRQLKNITDLLPDDTINKDVKNFIQRFNI